MVFVIRELKKLLELEIEALTICRPGQKFGERHGRNPVESGAHLFGTDRREAQYPIQYLPKLF